MIASKETKKNFFEKSCCIEKKTLAYLGSQPLSKLLARWNRTHFHLPFVSLLIFHLQITTYLSDWISTLPTFLYFNNRVFQKHLNGGFEDSDPNSQDIKTLAKNIMAKPFPYFNNGCTPKVTRVLESQIKVCTRISDIFSQSQKINLN